MPTEQERRKAQMTAAALSRTEPGARPAGRTAIRSKPVRITLDLSPELYRQLTQWAHSAAIELDVPRVALADAVRAMIKVSTESPDQVIDRLRRDRQLLTRVAARRADWQRGAIETWALAVCETCVKSRMSTR